MTEKYFIAYKNASASKQIQLHLPGTVPPPRVSNVSNPGLHMRLLSQTPPSIDTGKFQVTHMLELYLNHEETSGSNAKETLYFQLLQPAL